jgi:hypothetical protein
MVEVVETIKSFDSCHRYSTNCSSHLRALRANRLSPVKTRSSGNLLFRKKGIFSEEQSTLLWRNDGLRLSSGERVQQVCMEIVIAGKVRR